MSIERVNEKIDGLRDLLEVHEKHQEEQFADMRAYFDLKFTIERCNDCNAAKKVDALSGKVDSLQTYRNYIMGGLVIIGIIIPYILPKLMG